MTPLQNPLLPASYDVVWSLSLVAVLGAVVVGVTLLVRVARRPARPTALERVGTLATLRESGAISEEEYQARKNRVLDEL